MGQKPVALAISPDGGHLFSINQGDSSITKINLQSLFVEGTTQVGGTLTSASVDQSGNLWVGTMQNIVRLNADTLQSLGVYGLSGRSILSMKFNSSSAMLTATVKNGNGDISVMTIDPQATTNNSQAQIIRADASYHHLRSNDVYSDSSASMGRPMQTASATETGETLEDGWLSISATPDGFVVVDTTNNVEVMHGATPGAVTSIALASSGDAVYLTIPDANAVITVPLPAN